jgi:ZIP family zinc transporter
MEANAKNALVMSLVAGLSTGLGGCIVFFVTSVSDRVMSFTLSLAAGVMTSVSLLELMQPIKSGLIMPILWAFVGSAFYAILRLALPENNTATANATGHKKNHEENRARLSDDEEIFAHKARQWRLGVLMMATLTAHNLPEGVAVAVGALKSTRTGVVVMSAIAMHNIPEGLAIAIPVYAATGNRWKALGMTLASGLSEPLGAALGILVLHPFLTHSVVDNATCSVGGIMLAVSVLELLPEARKHREKWSCISGFLVGWLVIFITVTYA